MALHCGVAVDEVADDQSDLAEPEKDERAWDAVPGRQRGSGYQHQGDNSKKRAVECGDRRRRHVALESPAYECRPKGEARGGDHGGIRGRDSRESKGAHRDDHGHDQAELRAGEEEVPEPGGVGTTLPSARKNAYQTREPASHSVAAHAPNSHVRRRLAGARI